MENENEGGKWREDFGKIQRKKGECVVPREREERYAGRWKGRNRNAEMDEGEEEMTVKEDWAEDEMW